MKVNDLIHALLDDPNIPASLDVVVGLRVDGELVLCPAADAVLTRLPDGRDVFAIVPAEDLGAPATDPGAG